MTVKSGEELAESPSEDSGFMVPHSFPADGNRADRAVQTEKCLAVFDSQNIIRCIQDLCNFI